MILNSAAQNDPNYIEKLVDEFECDLNCPLNCCLDSLGGGFIEGDYERLKQYDGKKLIDGSTFRLRDCIEKNGDEIKFCQDENGVCLLLKDGKCLIQASFGRQALSYECREYPRRIFSFGDHTEKMLDPECPKVTEIFLKQELWFWDYMTKVIEPDPEGLFEKRRKLILALKGGEEELSETLDHLCDEHGIDMRCRQDKKLPVNMEGIVRHLFACAVFGYLFEYGYESEIFDELIYRFIGMGVRLYDYLSEIDDISRENIAVHFNRGCYKTFEADETEKHQEVLLNVMREAGI
ncbi:MAG: hypothetical protein J6P45_09490 [Lachnospiraceae bacterium]|nr:hypothetical protein [Lachnospiraceae bacterium]